ncbi:hypothetical protein CEXT_303861 [Caerostris extrusa]|uniref:Uncharacterized protein n=1 Tax=Caerostris extrusa TaxID=172846 RepID=A0AAV4SET4_CAEEX|nr:hypothetical protein CEXT_303861 [Caerostris extrusa]
MQNKFFSCKVRIPPPTPMSMQAICLCAANSRVGKACCVRNETAAGRERQWTKNQAQDVKDWGKAQGREQTRRRKCASLNVLILQLPIFR